MGRHVFGSCRSVCSERHFDASCSFIDVLCGSRRYVVVLRGIQLLEFALHFHFYQGDQGCSLGDGSSAVWRHSASREGANCWSRIGVIFVFCANKSWHSFSSRMSHWTREFKLLILHSSGRKGNSF